MTPLNEKNVLITGLGGFVGAFMAKCLSHLGMDVYGLQRPHKDGGTTSNLIDTALLSRITVLKGDLNDITSLNNALSLSNPDIIFHLGAQSFVPRSFSDPLETMNTNCIGTLNLLEAVRASKADPTIIFAGSSEEYGLVFSSQSQYTRAVNAHKTIFPEPQILPEVPVAETNPLRPLSPYGISKLCGDHLMRNYWSSYGIKTVVSRAFNHEGAGRGSSFVTSVITSQIAKLKLGEANSISIGNINPFRDWSHISDIVNGYFLLAEKGRYGDVYNLGSMRVNSVLSYLLLGLAEAGYPVQRIETIDGKKSVLDPLEPVNSETFGIKFEKFHIDDLMLNGSLEFLPSDNGLNIYTDSDKIKVIFNPDRFRPVEVPIILSDISKVKNIGFKVEYSIRDIIKDQLNYYLGHQIKG
jgi:GDPmannose 4,6-dehydratase